MSTSFLSRRRLALLLASALGGLIACRVGPRAADVTTGTAATQDDAEIDEKTRNPPAAAISAEPIEPPASIFTIPLPDFIPAQTLIRRWRINTVEREVAVQPKDWSLTVDGLVERPLKLTYEDVLALPPFKQTNDLHCVEGWGFHDIRWEGSHLSALFARVGVRPDATHVNFYTFPGVYADSLTLEQANLAETMIAHRANDEPLTADHGFPLRLVVPSMYGYKSVKWLDRIELARGRLVGYWEKRGWRPDPWIR